MENPKKKSKRIQNLIIIEIKKQNINGYLQKFVNDLRIKIYII